MSDEPIYAEEGILYNIGQGYFLLVKGVVLENENKIWIELHYDFNATSDDDSISDDNTISAKNSVSGRLNKNNPKKTVIDSFVISEGDSFVCNRIIDPELPADEVFASEDDSVNNKIGESSAPVISATYCKTYDRGESCLVEFNPFMTYPDPVLVGGGNHSEEEWSVIITKESKDDPSGNSPQEPSGTVSLEPSIESSEPSTESSETPIESSEISGSDSSNDSMNGSSGWHPGSFFGRSENIMLGSLAVLIIAGILLSVYLLYFRKSR